MFLYLFIITTLLDTLNAYLSDYQEITHRNYMPAEEIEFEPVTALTKEREKYALTKSINCDDFSRFALNCTVEAAFIYNSTRISPPMPEKIGDWCKAIKHLVNCAIDWNADCRDVTQDHFNEEGIRGHIHVIQSICDDEWFLTLRRFVDRNSNCSCERTLHAASFDFGAAHLTKCGEAQIATIYKLIDYPIVTGYLDIGTCVDNKASNWESCYVIFKKLVEQEKNTTHEWTHYDTHFNLCCARAEFRRCTLETLFRIPATCSYENAVTLQKFSVIISEGAVYQDCDRNMMYSNCPGGDPRPSSRLLSKLVNSNAFNKAPLIYSNFFNSVLIVLLASFYINKGV